jgi:uncharacterized DUF497 family protein
MSFEVAQLAFYDLFAVVREDRRQDYGEDRHILLGMVQDRLLAISHAHSARAGEVLKSGLGARGRTVVI